MLPVLLKAVGIAHRQGLIHGHLRAHNVFMVKGRGPVIADYGLPVALADLESYRDLLAYLAPEQLPHVRSIGFPTDIYGIGLIGYTLLAGKLPFDPSMDPRRVVSDVTTIEPRRPPGSDALVDTVMRMLSKSPSSRPTAEEALDRIVPKLH